MESTMIAATSAIAGVATVFGAILVYSARSDRELMEGVKRSTEENLIKLKSKEVDLKVRESKVHEDVQSVKEQQAALSELEKTLKEREVNLKSKSEALDRRESAVTEAEAKLKSKEEELHQRQEELEKQEAAFAESSKSAAGAEDKTLDTTLDTDEELEDTDDEPVGDSDIKASSEADKRNKMIEEELMMLVKKADEEELEEPFDEESVEALRKAAHKICYIKKYYDVMKDAFIYFPSVSKTLVDYSLLEEAEKHYYEEEDEYPQDLSIGIRSVATMQMAEADDDMDEDYMLALAQDVAL
jgi:DNA repair exonuclease SbcCD ATPase subunit